MATTVPDAGRRAPHNFLRTPRAMQYVAGTVRGRRCALALFTLVYTCRQYSLVSFWDAALLRTVPGGGDSDLGASHATSPRPRSPAAAVVRKTRAAERRDVSCRGATAAANASQTVGAPALSKEGGDTLLREDAAVNASQGSGSAIAVRAAPAKETTKTTVADASRVAATGRAAPGPAALPSLKSTPPKRRSGVTAREQERTDVPRNVTAAGPRPVAGEVPRHWTCNSPGEDPARRLIFLHIFKTAGSSFRAFFWHYAKVCGRRYVTVLCRDVAAASLRKKWSPWRRGDGKDCAIKSYSGQRQYEAAVPETLQRLSYGTLERGGIDIIGGHMPMGMHRNWHHGNQRARGGVGVVKPLYITFVRDPLLKYVSGRLYMNNLSAAPPWSHDQAVEEIKKHIFRMGDFYDGYAKYLLTPEQKEAPLAMEDRVRLAKANLLDFNVLVGTVEAMDDSLDLIRYAINGDRDPRINATFAMLDPKDGAAGSNVSTLSTRSLLEEIVRDEAARDKLRHILRYDTEIYDFAAEIHRQQVQQVRQQSTGRGKRTKGRKPGRAP